MSKMAATKEKKEERKEKKELKKGKKMVGGLGKKAGMPAYLEGQLFWFNDDLNHDLNDGC